MPIVQTQPFQWSDGGLVTDICIVDHDGKFIVDHDGFKIRVERLAIRDSSTNTSASPTASSELPTTPNDYEKSILNANRTSKIRVGRANTSKVSYNKNMNVKQDTVDKNAWGKP